MIRANAVLRSSRTRADPVDVEHAVAVAVATCPALAPAHAARGVGPAHDRKSAVNPLCIHSHRSCRNGWQFVCWTADPIAARNAHERSGQMSEPAKIKRDLVLGVDPSLYPEIKGQSDTEVLFYLALTFGLEDDPPTAVGAAIGLVEACAERQGIPNPFQGTIATSNGEVLWAFRYSSEGKSRSLFHSRDIHTLRKLYPERKILEDLSDDARLVVSEPIGDLPGAWNEVPEATYGVHGNGRDELLPFTVTRPSTAVAPSG
jgi:hypothetical protein